MSEPGRSLFGTISGALLIGLFVLWGCQLRPAGHSAGESSRGSPALAQSDSATFAPDFSRRTLSGTQFRLSDHRGEVVVLNFCATWCAPCRVEIPDFVALQKRLGDEGLLFVGITTEKGPAKNIRAFADRFSVNYPIIRGGPRLLHKYGGVSRIPTTYVIDAVGRVRYGRIGRVPPDTLTDVVRTLLREQSSAADAS